MRPTREASIFDDDQLHIQTANIVEALINLNYLVSEEADNPSKVRRYASMTEERLNAIVHLLKTNFPGGRYGRSEPR